MPKFRVCVVESREHLFEVDAVAPEQAAELALAMPLTDAIRSSKPTFQTGLVQPKKNAEEIAVEMLIGNTRRIYELVEKERKLPDGTEVTEDDVEDILRQLATLHDNLIDEHGLPLLKIVEANAETNATAQTETKEELVLDPKMIWNNAATILGWKYDADYKGWIKPENKKPGATHGEWDAYVRDMTAEDACNEEGIDTLNEAKQVVSGGRIAEGSDH